MSVAVMTLLLVGGWGIFGWSMVRRWRILRAGASENRFDRLFQRTLLTFQYALGQARMPRDRWPGVAHVLIFAGFLVFVLRTLILWGRGYDPQFEGWWFAPDQRLGMIYAAAKDVALVIVVLGVAVFLYFRLVHKSARLTHNVEGLVILLMIVVLMVGDGIYDGAQTALTHGRHPTMFVGNAVSEFLTNWSSDSLHILVQVTFWMHTVVMLIFLNVLPYTKHFHILTAIPNVFFQDLKGAGCLKSIGDIEGKVERGETLGLANRSELSWKDILDLYSCTECGRCSEVCPATLTGKKLSPKHLTVALRDHALGTFRDVSDRKLVSESLIAPEVLWACTSCRACETECPVFISYVDKIVGMRRHVVMEQSEFPAPLQGVFRNLESSGNPWGYPVEDRMKWAAGLEVPLIADRPDADYLLWVGCMSAFDARAQQSLRALVRLLQHAGVRFAVLGSEERCTGDAARRAGNEYLFEMLARQNIETLSRYGVRRIVTPCPHCYHTLGWEYKDFGGVYEVLHHTELLNDLVRTGRLQPRTAVPATTTYHDPCYLGRAHDVYESPRQILGAIPELKRIEASPSRDRAMCCGAGGAQMFKEEEQGRQRINVFRVDQIIRTLREADGAQQQLMTTACPFCLRMLTDGVPEDQRTSVAPQDVVELLCRSVLGTNP